MLYNNWIIAHRRNIVDVLDELRSIQLSGPDFLQLLSRVKPRLYSISSSMRRHPNCLHITVSVVNEPIAEGILIRHYWFLRVIVFVLCTGMCRSFDMLHIHTGFV
ncbi:hypothetical protein, partial [Acinetobacter baumannii]|uniref:hypothetical protein n=1 Tax=Acinetobacter baumannii TaxID=470 RepID=UPI0033978E30